jgi:hypothetical protein
VKAEINALLRLAAAGRTAREVLRILGFSEREIQARVEQVRKQAI